MKIQFDQSFSKLWNRFPFVVIDAGARGGLKSEWQAMQPFLRCIGFEPDPVAYKKLRNESAAPSVLSYHQTALWDENREIPLHVTEAEGRSSVRLPNEGFLKHFDSLNTKGYKLEREEAISASKLDDLLAETDKKTADFIKIDVEGAAYEILKGARRTLLQGTILGLRIEAEFNPKYCGERLHSEVDQLLRDLDYQLFDIRICRWKRAAGLKTGGVDGQPVHGDFIYFLDNDVLFEKINSFSPDEKTAKVGKFIVFLCCYGIYDTALEITEEALKRNILSYDQASSLRHELNKTKGFLMRIPKLKGRGLLSDLAYHLWMLVAGIWMERAGYWNPKVEIETTKE